MQEIIEKTLQTLEIIGQGLKDKDAWVNFSCDPKFFRCWVRVQLSDLINLDDEHRDFLVELILKSRANWVWIHTLSERYLYPIDMTERELGWFVNVCKRDGVPFNMPEISKA